MATPSSSAASDPLWLDPAEISFKISPHDDLGLAQDGVWDRERRHLLAETVKYRSIVQRFAQGVPWEETPLFLDIYQRRIKSGETVRGMRAMKALAAQYYDRVDGLFDDMQDNGFRTDVRSLPVLMIGRGGEVFIGNQGNHRLAIAQVLGLKTFAGRIICRHPLSRP